MPRVDPQPARTPRKKPPRLRDLVQVARKIGQPAGVAARFAREIPPTARHRGRDLWNDEAVERFVELAATLAPPPVALPRLPGSRWRLKICDQCGATFDPSGPNAKRCSEACRETARDTWVAEFVGAR